MHVCERTIPFDVILVPEISLIWPAGQVPSSTLIRCPSRRSPISRSRETGCAVLTTDARPLAPKIAATNIRPLPATRALPSIKSGRRANSIDELAILKAVRRAIEHASGTYACPCCLVRGSEKTTQMRTKHDRCAVIRCLTGAFIRLKGAKEKA